MDMYSKDMYIKLRKEYIDAHYRGLTTDYEHQEALYELRLEYAEYGVLFTRNGRRITPEEVTDKYLSETPY